MTALAEPRFEHLLDMSDWRGTFEHALLTEPRREHGYCTDDVARVLIVAVREPHPSRALRDLAEVSLRFLGQAQGYDGDSRNRMDERGRWRDRASLGDCWGRSIWALGTAARRAPDGWMRDVAAARFERGARGRSPWLRPMAFAAIGAAEMLAVRPEHRVAHALLVDAAEQMPPAGTDEGWPWPEERLTYANAVVPEAMLAAGSALARPELVRRGLDLLGWLLEHETGDGHLSVTPTGGSGPEEARPAFDQQPIEVAALADACARAAVLEPDDQRWVIGVERCVDWFLGANDGAHVMWDPATGGGYDGLQAHGPNLNQGAESTLAALATLQHARNLVAR